MIFRWIFGEGQYRARFSQTSQIRRDRARRDLSRHNARAPVPPGWYGECLPEQRQVSGTWSRQRSRKIPPRPTAAARPRQRVSIVIFFSTIPPTINHCDVTSYRTPPPTRLSINKSASLWFIFLRWLNCVGKTPDQQVWHVHLDTSTYMYTNICIGTCVVSEKDLRVIGLFEALSRLSIIRSSRVVTSAPQ